MRRAVVGRAVGTRLGSVMRSHSRRLPVTVSAALHVAVFGCFALQWTNTVPSVDRLDQSIEMVFAAVVEPAPELAASIAAMPDLPAEPIAPEPLPEPQAEPTPALAEPLTPPALQAPPLPVSVPAPPRPKPVAARPPRQAAPVASPSPASAVPAITALPPPAAAPFAATPVATGTDPGWRTALGSWLAAHKRYPERARQRGDEGTVGVRFTVDAAGRVLDVAITRSSGSTLLDDAARDMLAGQRVPPFPPSMAFAQTTVPVNVRFQLEQ
jgi:periplasmic protein TonB